MPLVAEINQILKNKINHKISLITTSKHFKSSQDNTKKKENLKHTVTRLKYSTLE